MTDDKSDVKKVVLAYSGGLDTSVILRWLQDVYNCEVVTFTADLGQGEELEPARQKAEMLGVKEIYVEDLREEPRCERSRKRDGTVRARSDGTMLSDRDAAAIGLE